MNQQVPLKHYSRGALYRLLIRARFFIETLWPHGPGAECEETSRWLVRVIGPQARLQCGTDWRRLPRPGGGTMQVDSGYWNQETHRWCSHYWVDVKIGERTWIADLTADQFGGKPIVLTQSPSRIYRPNVPQVDEMLHAPQHVHMEVRSWYAAWCDWHHDPKNIAAEEQRTYDCGY